MFAFRFEKVIRCGNTMPDPDADASLSPAQSAKIPHPAAILKVALQLKVRPTLFLRRAAY